MGVLEPPGGLHGEVQDAGQGPGGAALVQAAVPDQVTQAAPGDVLGEDPGNTAEDAYVVAAADVRVQPEGHPGLGLAHEVPPLFGRAEQLGARALHGQVRAPFAVPHPVDEAHAAGGVHAGHLVLAGDDVAELPQLPRGRHLSGSGRRAAP
ncbi:hypothetical protein GCM10018987_55530 [Streptomyces cremeus]